MCLSAAEIEHVSSLFQEKQAELQSAMLKVDQLTQQLDDLRRGRLNGLQPLGGPVTSNAALELRKLYQELQVDIFCNERLTQFVGGDAVFWFCSIAVNSNNQKLATISLEENLTGFIFNILVSLGKHN